MDRRSFLKATAAIIATSAAIPVVAKVSSPVYNRVADPIINQSLQVPEPVSESKYVVALRLYDEAVQARKFPYILMPRVDKLMAFVHDNFAVPKFTPEDKALVREVLQNNDIPAMVEKFRRTPPVIQDAIWPIVMMIGLMRWEALPINHLQLKEFEVFHDRYGRFVLEC